MPRLAPPNAMRRAPHMKLLVLFAIIGVYTVGVTLWNVFSHSLTDSDSSAADVKLSPQLLRQLEREKRLEEGNTSLTFSTSSLLSGSKEPDLRCIGWKQTDACGAPAIPVRGCDQFVRGGVAGYCVLKDELSGREMQVMHIGCDTLHPSVMLSCRHAVDFVDFQWAVFKLAESIEKQEKKVLKSAGVRGIVMVIYPKLLVSAYATIRTLRAMNCTLPVELWYLESEMGRGSANESLMETVPVKLQQEFGPLKLRGIDDVRVKGFNSKIYAILHSEFDQAIFLDADNVPVRDPTYLFETPEFKETGAIFWPDFWHPLHTIFGVNADSLLWEMLGMPFVDMFEQESGQLVIDKTRSEPALRMLSLFAFHDPNLFSRYKLAHGDKDLFRLAWLKTKTPFHMIANPPGIAGSVREKKFCGMSMVQFDPRGEVLFLHRNARKLTGGLAPKHEPDTLIWTHLQRFRYRAASPHAPEMEAKFEDLKPTVQADERIGNPRVAVGNLDMSYDLLRKKYAVGIFNGAPEFDETQWCYGQPKLTVPRYKTIAWDETSFSDVETHLLEYAAEAVALMVKAS